MPAPRTLRPRRLLHVCSSPISGDQRRAPILRTGNDFSRTDVAVEPLA